MTTVRAIPALLLAAFLLSLSVGVSPGVEESADFLLRDYKSGSNKTLRDVLISDVNVLVVTETTCYACIKELKAMEVIRRKNAGKVSVSAVFLDREGWPRVKKYLDFYQFDIDFSLVDSAQTVPERFKTKFVPTMIIFDRKGTEVFRKRGFTDGEEGLLNATVEDLLFPRRASLGQDAPASATTGAEGNAPVVKSSGCAGAG